MEQCQDTAGSGHQPRWWEENPPGSLKDSRRRTTMAPANGPMAVRRLSRLPPSSLVKRGSNTKLLVHASVSSLATEPFATPTLPPWDVVIIREKDNPGGKDLLAL